MRIGFGLAFLLLCCHTWVQGEEDEEESVVELQLADFDLIDAYDEISTAARNHLLNITDYTLKIQLEKDLGDLLKLQAKTNNELADVPYSYQRNWDLLTNTGKFLLPKLEYEKLVDFINENENLRKHSTLGVDNEGYLKTLATERNIKVLSELWSSWQTMFHPNENNFFSILSLLNDTCKLNGEDTVRSFWEMQTEYENGYEKAEKLWRQIQPLYVKLHDFVKLRVLDFYGLNNNNDSNIPVYLLGSNFGNDWSNVAEIVLPHPFLYSQVNQKLKQQNVKHIYKLAENEVQKMNLGPLGKQFWKRSHFNFSSCGPYLFSFCNKKYTEVFTCNKLDFTTFMNIHETAINVALRNQDYMSLARREMRYSAVDEAIQGLGALIALHNLPLYGLVSEEKWSNKFDDDNIRNSALLIMALRVLPRLPYYLLSDTWRLNTLKNTEGNFTEDWWNNRNQNQGVCGNDGDEVDFIGDDFISSNKPYLSKFLGILLQFQLYDYYNKYYSFDNGTVADFIKQDESFMKFVDDRSKKGWLELLNFYYNIDDISAKPLLEYFEPLVQYLDRAVDEFQRSSPSTQHSNVVTDLTYSTTETYYFNATSQSTSLESTPKSGSHEKVWILLGVGGLVLVSFVLAMFIRKLRRKRKTNNRRFET